MIFFVDFMVDHGFTQFVTEPTRCNNVLDLLFCNDPILMSSVDVVAPFGSSDHNAVEFPVLSKADVIADDDTCDYGRRYIWAQGDYQSMAAYLHNIRWAEILTTNFTPNDL